MQVGERREFFSRKASGLVRQLSATDALMFNLVYMSLNLSFLFMFWGPMLYPGMNAAWATILAAPLMFIVAMTYLFFATSMPRSGGDFVWVSRALHPSIGFMANFILTVVTLSYIGFQSVWVLDPGLSNILIGLGTIFKNPAMIEQAKVVSTQTNLVIVGIVLALLTLLVVVAGTRGAWRVMWGCFFIIAIGVALYLFSMVSIGHEGFVARFNELSGRNYDDIIAAANTAGYNTSFTLTGTLVGMAYVFGNFWGFQGSAYVGGEIKDVGRSQVYAMLGSLLLFTAISYAVYQVTYSVVGSEFMNSAIYLARDGNAAWGLPLPPFASYLIVFATDNPWIVTWIGFTLILYAVSQDILIFVVATRWIFAWSFDRIIPSAFSDVEKRFHVPRNALILCFFVGLFFLYLTVFTTVLSFFSYGILAVWIGVGIVGLAAAVFPFRRKDIYEKSPKMVQTKIAGVPLMTIFGIITWITGWFAGAAMVLPQFTGAPVNPYYSMMIAGLIVLAFVIYGIARWYNARIGIDMDVGFRELPPL